MPIDISQLLRAAGGEIVGKVRLQKAVYLLDQIGLQSGFDFDYHHYGPYSAELADAVDESIAFGTVRETSGRRVADGVPYSVFRAEDHDEAGPRPVQIGGMMSTDVATALSKMNTHSSTVLELAATIHWLAYVEEDEDWRDELVRRKGIKADAKRTTEALRLLADLDLSPNG